GLSTGQTTAILALASGDLLVGTDTGDIWRFTSDKFEPLAIRSTTLPGSTVKSIAFNEQSQTLWIAHDGAGLYRHHSGTLERVKLTGKEFEFLNHLMLDDQGALWVGTQYDGLF